jgi:hypothetical protein
MSKFVEYNTQFVSTKLVPTLSRQGTFTANLKPASDNETIMTASKAGIEFPSFVEVETGKAKEGFYINLWEQAFAKSFKDGVSCIIGDDKYLPFLVEFKNGKCERIVPIKS